MSGINDYENNYENKIKRLLDCNKDKDYLEGFYYFTLNSKVGGLSSRYNYLLTIVRFVNTIKKNVDKITLDDYNIYLGKQNNKTSSYQITQYAALKKFSTYLYATKRNTENPMQFISRPKFSESIETKEKRDNGYLNKSEIKDLIKSVNNGCGSKRAKLRQEEWKERDLAIIMLFLSTGLRCSGLYKLDISSVDFKNNKIITIEKGNKIKESYVPENVMDILTKWKTKRNELLSEKKCDALFISNRRNRLSQNSISEIISKYSSVIKNKNITPHKLRATYGTSLYNETKDIKFVQNCMGHNSSHTTELYIRGNNDKQKEAANIMSSILT